MVQSMVLKAVKVQEEDYETVLRELNKRGIEYRSIGDAFTKFINLGLEGKLAPDTPHPPEQSEPEQQSPSGEEQKVTEPVPGAGNGGQLGVVAMDPEILKGLKIDLEREASNIANNSVIRLYYAYARAKRGYRGTLEQFVTEAVRDSVENRGEGKSAFLCFVEA